MTASADRLDPRLAPSRRGRFVVIHCLSLGLGLGPVASEAAPVRGRLGMVVSAEAQASQAGVEVLRAGGNAVDAAVATAFALAVTWPAAGNLGGGGFWTGRDAKGALTSYDFREVAPAAATPNLYTLRDPDGKKKLSLEGPLASGVPGTVAGLSLAHKRGGRLPWSACLQPALRLARDGMLITENIHREFAGELQWLRTLPEAAAIFLSNKDRSAPVIGSKLRQPDLYQTLRRIAEQGPDGFYKGPVADQIVAWQRRGGGLITHEDLASYRALERAPLRFRYAGHDVATMGLPSSGATLASIAMMADSRAGQLARVDTAAVHLVAEIEKLAFADRNHYFGDPAFVRVPLAELLAPARLLGMVATIRPDRATPATPPATPPRGERLQTTHFSVIDREGAVVAVTTTLNGGFGSGEVVPGGGFFMNNEMDDFATHPERPNLYGLIQGGANEVRGKKRMLSSMCPSIASKGGKVVLVWGSPGGTTILTTNFQILWHVVGRGLPLAEALAAPRFHQQDRPDHIAHEPGFAPQLLDGLRALGHELKPVRELGSVNAIQVLPDGTRVGVSDPRHGGAASAEP